MFYPVSLFFHGPGNLGIERSTLRESSHAFQQGLPYICLSFLPSGFCGDGCDFFGACVQKVICLLCEILVECVLRISESQFTGEDIVFSDGRCA